jgi:phage regulator Rha-like protein
MVMNKKKVDFDVAIEPVIHHIRGQRVILDMDLAKIYGVSSKRLNEQVRRNIKKFPEDFMFQLSKDEISLRSQFATSKKGRGGRRYLPYAFTEQGAIMAANVLNSPSAVRMSVFVVRAFMRMREILSGQKELACQLIDLEKKLSGRLDLHETAIVDILKRIMEIVDPPAPPPVPAKPRIGFHP